LSFWIASFERLNHDDHSHALGLLCLCRQRPYGCRATEKRDELAPFHGHPLQQATTPYHVAELSAVFCITAKLAADVREGRPGRASSKSGHVRYAPVATKFRTAAK
jgi:hypothetical protein